MSINKIQIKDIYLSYGNFKDFADYIYGQLESEEKQLILVHINLRNYYFMNKDKLLYDNIKNNSIPVFEGIGMKICLALKGYGFLHDLNGTDLFPLILKKLEGTDHKIFLLGASENAVTGTSDYINKNFQNVKVTGYHNGYFEIQDEEKILESIEKSKADILMTGMGFPLQEKFIFKYRSKLKVSLIWNLGGLFDIVSGLKPRAPHFMRSIRLEWLYRFIKEPIRMFHRNSVAAAWSFGNILVSKKN